MGTVFKIVGNMSVETRKGGLKRTDLSISNSGEEKTVFGNQVTSNLMKELFCII